jgi:hypothetical protein
MDEQQQGFRRNRGVDDVLQESRHHIVRHRESVSQN